MGNYASCVLAGKKSKDIKVIFPTGEVKQFDQQMKAAELMLELPNYFLVNSLSLQIGRRFSPLNADDDLDIGNVYVLFPMKKVNSFVVAGDVAVVFFAAKRSVGKVRVVPTTFSCDDMETELSSGESDACEKFGLGLPVLQNRKFVSRSKKPVLETILE